MTLLSERKKDPNDIVDRIFNTSFSFFFFVNFKTWWCGIGLIQEINFVFFFYINNIIFKLQILYTYYYYKNIISIISKNYFNFNLKYKLL